MFGIVAKIKNKLLRRGEYDKFVIGMKKKNVTLSYPYSIFNEYNLVCQEYVYIGPSSWMSLFGKLFIGKGTVIGPRVKIHTANHNYEGDMLPYDEKVLIKDVFIGENVWIGADVTILPGVKIGEGAVVGACSCVTKDIPPLAIVAGNPAKILKYRNSSRYEYNKISGNIYLKKKQEGLVHIKEVRI